MKQAITRREFIRGLGGSSLGLVCVPPALALHPRGGFAPARQIGREGAVEFNSSDTSLVAGFRWAKAQALAYVHDGDPVGPWFEASLPGRNAFCMRDTAHMSTGAEVLGMASRTKNMLRKFAQGITASRDWCSFWEIARDNKPAPVDYQNDRKFWYNLPANFDVLNACYRQFVWTGDRDYLAADFLAFYDHTVTDYVRTWDKDGSGFPEHLPEYGARGIATYDEDVIDNVRVGADLVAAQYAAYCAYASIQQVLGKTARAAEFREKAEQIKEKFNHMWWNEKDHCYSLAIGNNGSLINHLPATVGGSLAMFPLYFGLTESGARTQSSLKNLAAQYPLDEKMAPKLREGVEGRTYLPNIYYRYGLSLAGYDALLGLMNPALPRREYPEVSYSVVGNLATGFMGIGVDAATGAIRTFPQLVDETAWASIDHVPIRANRICVRHDANGKTTLTNKYGPALQWRAGFPAAHSSIQVDGKDAPTRSSRRDGGVQERYTIVTVRPGEAITAAVVRSH